MLNAAMMTMLALFAATPLPATDNPPPPSAADYRDWMAQPGNKTRVWEFQRYLSFFGVRGVLPTYQLLRTATDWRSCGVPFEVPPPLYWARIVAPLRFIRDEIKPRIGGVEAVSGYRNPDLNRCAEGAPGSAHTGFWGVDLVPSGAITQDEMFRRLCALHRTKGEAAQFGLGFYGGMRFHVDMKSYRMWGADNRSGTSPCL